MALSWFEERKGGDLVTTNPAAHDLEAIHAYLSRSYWSENIPRALVKTAIENSISFSVLSDGRHVGFARAVTDRATFAYVADVFIIEEFRGRGLSVWLMQAMRRHPELQGLRKWLLMTKDAHGLYRKVGFDAPKEPSRVMEINVPGIYKGRSHE